MIRILCLLALLPMAGAAALQTAPPAPSPADYGTIEGTVIWTSRGTPLEGVAVYVVQGGGPPQLARSLPTTPVLTDSGGRFFIKDVAPGGYSLIAERRGHFRDTDSFSRVTVAAKQQVKNVVIKMFVGGIISGRILDVNGLGLADIQVTASQPSYLPDGKREMQGRVFTGTDERGEYRLTGLRPSEYYVRTSDGVWASDAETYYPGVKEVSRAVAVTVREGVDSGPIGFRLETPLKPVFTISGTVSSPVPGTIPERIERIFVSYRNEEWTYYDNRVLDGSNGRFEIRNVPPGLYNLFPEVRDSQGRLYTSRNPIEVVDRSVDNLTLTVSPGVDVRGRVIAPPGLESFDPAVILESTDGVPGEFFTENGLFTETGFGRKIDKGSGEFTLTNVPSGVYKLALASGLPQDFYVEDVRQGGASVYENGFRVGEQAGPPVEMVLASPGGKIDGVVRNSKQEPIRATVVLIPQGAKRHTADRYSTSTTDMNGRFAMRGIAPSDYKVFAWESPVQFAWFNDEYMQKYESRGLAVSIISKESVTLQLTAIGQESN